MLLICSVHSLLNAAPFERAAFNLLLKRQKSPVRLNRRDYARVMETTTIPDMLTQIPWQNANDQCLVKSFVECLNDQLWSANTGVHASVQTALSDAYRRLRPRAFVSEYPLSTTNLFRAAALGTKATRLGKVVAPEEVKTASRLVEGLKEAARALDIPNREVEVLVARTCDYEAAQSIGMHPRYIDERLKFGQEIPALGGISPTCDPNGCQRLHAIETNLADRIVDFLAPISPVYETGANHPLMSLALKEEN